MCICTTLCCNFSQIEYHDLILEVIILVLSLTMYTLTLIGGGMYHMYTHTLID
jgi:hypothetical protein